MPVEIRVPTLGESIVEATVGKWHKNVGDSVAQGEVLVELETDKVNVDVAADASGVLGRIDAQSGSDVAVGQVIGTIETNGAAASSGTTNATEPGAPADAPAQSQTVMAQPAAPAQPVQPGQPALAGQPADNRTTSATPVARRVAEANNIDIQGMQGSGPSGKIMKNDVAAKLGEGSGGAAGTANAHQQQTPASAQTVAPTPAPAAKAPTPQAPAPASQSPSAKPQAGTDGREERRRMSRRRMTIARRLVEAQHTAAMLTTFNEADMTAIMELRKRRNPDFEKRNGVKLGFMSFFTKAVVGALKAFPLLNAEIQGDEIIIKKYYDIGIAVGAEEGLVVPVVRDADRKGFAQIEKEIGDLAKKARDNTLGLAELQGGTFTITNGGIFGSLMSTPILNAPQVGILGMHSIKERPMVIKGEVVVRPMMYLALSYDHRIVDGSEAVRFLVRVKEMVEDPESLLLEG
jgi:2-oxoglutarate dehydrogenase E2 component (dihydrolipoamide succinyltransferase)